MTDWNKAIGQFSKKRNEEASEVDKSLENLAKNARYGYEQEPRSQLLEKEKIYQSYNQSNGENGIMENENHHNYQAVSLDDHDGTDKPDEEEEAEEKVTKRTIIELLVCILAFVGRGLCLNSIGPTMIDLRQIADIEIKESSWIFVSQSAGFFIGSVIAKAIFQRFNSELVLAAFLGLQALSTALIPAFHSLALMCIMFVGQGVAIGTIGVGVCATCIRLGGKTRNGMYLQAVYMGVSVGSVIGPFIAHPFLSEQAKHVDNRDLEAPLGLEFPIRDEDDDSGDDIIYGDKKLTNKTIQFMNSSISNSTDSNFNTKTHVVFYYVFIAFILCAAAVCFLVLYIKRENNSKKEEKRKNPESLALTECTGPLATAIIMLFMQCLLYFGMQDCYSNLITTFAVLGPLQMPKPKGVYLASAFWASMLIGRVNGIWIAKFVSPFKMLLVDFAVSTVAAISLVILAGKFQAVLWGFTVVLGLSFATVNGAAVSWAAAHMPENNYILSVIMIGRCIGLLLLPTIITAIFDTAGAMSLMAALCVTVILMLLTVIVGQLLAVKFGVNGRLHGKSFNSTTR